MKVMVFGVMRMQGRSAKTGAAYDMSRLYVASSIQPKATEAYVREGAGFESAEVELDPAAMPVFVALKYPIVLDLETDMRLQGGKLVPCVTGIAQKAAA